MTFHNKTIAYSLGITAICISISSASATTYTGSLDSENGLTGTADWANSTTLSWVITNEIPPVSPIPSNFVWKYTYTLQVPTKSPSHVIIEASDGNPDGSGMFTDVNFWNVSDITMYDSIQMHYPTDEQGDNPLMPSEVYGIKLEGWTEDHLTLGISFYSDRVPVWGDFYAKDGVSNVKGTKIPVVVYNDGFAADDPTAPAADGSLQGHLLVPDTTPEPSLLTLLGTGGLGLLRRKRRQK